MKNTLPVILLKNLLILPNQEVKLELNNELSQNVVLLSTNEYHKELIVVSPKDQMEELPEESDLLKITVIAKIKSKIELPNGNLRVTLRGLFRAKIKEYKNDGKIPEILIGTYKKLDIPKYEELEAQAVKRKLNSMITTYVKKGTGVSNSILNVIKGVQDLNKLTDLIAAFLPIHFFRKLEYIEEMNPVTRGEHLLEDLQLELEVIKLEEKLEQKLQSNLEESQREYLLKEKLHAIEEELGTNDKKKEEVRRYLSMLENISFPSLKIKEKVRSEIEKFEYMSDVSPELSNIRNYLDWMFTLPWCNSSVDEENIKSIQKSLDKSHYGMGKAKEKVIEYIASKVRNQEMEAPILCFVGQPGVGKTTLAKSIADALHKEFYKISVGGLNDSSVLNGHRRTYLGSNPGKIIEALKKCGTNNPVILIDEVDKMVRDYKGDPSSVLLDILDKSQNQFFVDHYIEEEFDLSHVFFILTANTVSDIPYELYDRLEIVELISYSSLEKIEIAKKYLLPKIYQSHAIEAKEVRFTDSILKEIIENYTKEAGVRELQRVLVTVVRKLIVLASFENVKITHDILFSLLGEGQYATVRFVLREIPGVVNGLAVGGFGGFVMPIESSSYFGDETVKITGCVEKVLEESIDVAISYLHSNLDFYGLEEKDFKNKSFHMHFLDAAIKKDGSSAGVAILSSLLSLMKKVPISSNVAMSGEITLNGYVRKVGGLRNKIIGAFNYGIKILFIPKENHNELKELPREIFSKMEVIEITHYQEIYEKLFS